MENLISVIVCTYNQERTIGRTLDSILMQRCHVPFEIVIGEDCSTDHTRAVCEDYAARYPQIRLFCNEHNKGIIDNYFDCILASSGKYIADCAGDDFWTDPLKLEKQVSIMEQHPHVSMVITNWNFYDETSQKVRKGNQRKLDDITEGKRLLVDIVTQTGMNTFHLCTSLYRADIVRTAHEGNKYLFRHKDFGCEDMQVAFCMALNGDIAYLDDTTLNYSIGRNSVSAAPDETRQFRFVRQVTNLSFYLTQHYSLSSPRIDTFFQKRIFALYMHAFRAHSVQLRDEALRCEKEWRTSRTWPIRTISYIMHNKHLWNGALTARRILVSVKRLFR